LIDLAKGAGLEESARAYFARQGFVAIRSVSIKFEEEEVTDVDVWLYGRQGSGVRTRSVVDVKDKKSPKTFERVIWARGMQLALGCDRAIVVTSETNPRVTRFAHQQKVALVTAAFLRKSLTEDPLQNGRVIARQASDALQQMFVGLRAEIIAEFFAKEQNAALLFQAARELENAVGNGGNHHVDAVLDSAVAGVPVGHSGVEQSLPGLGFFECQPFQGCVQCYAG
jgi:hypothetical protein